MCLTWKLREKIPQEYQPQNEIKWQETTTVRQSNMTMVLSLPFLSNMPPKEVIQPAHFIAKTEINVRWVLPDMAAFSKHELNKWSS